MLGHFEFHKQTCFSATKFSLNAVPSASIILISCYGSPTVLTLDAALCPSLPSYTLITLPVSPFPFYFWKASHIDLIPVFMELWKIDTTGAQKVQWNVNWDGTLSNTKQNKNCGGI